ncbi:PGAP1-domain-containing protein [Hesseltinella vesiculosa]|uniref:GPI inositol-deacylase n=1 Tax=Hesseltinella vesiculosa TaxID=101127 RepID=A0A1X2G9K7_9FUNG|nr:PGAP1-domain-containing protein [Hesseltinella vesiculosa]
MNHSVSSEKSRDDQDDEPEDETAMHVSYPVATQPLPLWYRVSTAWALALLIIVLLAVSIVAVILDSFFHYQKDQSTCQESYMRPVFLKQDGFDSEMTRFAGKYSLYLYREKGVDLSDQPTGIPVLFIPGHAGSYKQVRSIASESSYYYYQNYARHMDNWDQGMRPLDFYTVDFNEEFSALHGQSLLEQAEYLNDAIDYILKLYPFSRRWGMEQHHPLPDPTSVMIVAHSMGGTVARAMFTMHNYQPSTINTIITLATPHLLPPAPFDWKLSQIYDDIHQFWKAAFEPTALSVHPLRPSPVDILKDVCLISIAGGNLDTTVSSDSANVNPFLPPSHGFTVFTSTVPFVWSGADHIQILSCNQVVHVLAKTLLNIVDARRGSQTKPLDERMHIMENAFLSGLEPRIGDGSDLAFGDLTFYDIKPNQSQFLLPGQRLVLDKDARIETPAMIFLPVYEGADAFSIMSNHAFGSHHPLELVLCSKRETLLKGTIRMGCRAAGDALRVALPSSTTDASPPYTFASVTFDEMRPYEFLALIDRHVAPWPHDFFLLAEPYDFDANTRTVDQSMLSIALKGIHLQLNPALYSTVHFTALESAMLAYHVRVHRPPCQQLHFPPLLRQSITAMHESKFYTNVHSSPIEMSRHGSMPFFANSPNPHNRKRQMIAPSPVLASGASVSPSMQQQFGYSSDDIANGLALQLWMDPTCPYPTSLDVTIDWYGSAGRIGFRNGILLPSSCFIVVLTLWIVQLRCYFNTGIYPSYMQAMVFSLRAVFPLLLIALSLATLSQTAQYEFAPLHEQWQQYFPTVHWHDVLTGRTDGFFWWLPPVGILLGIGLMTIIWFVVSTALRGLALLFQCVLPKPSTISSPTYIQPSTVSSSTMPPSASSGSSTSLHYAFPPHPWQQPPSPSGWSLLPLLDGIAHHDAERQRLERRIVVTLILFSLVATCIPYQFVFLVAFLVHLISCIRSYPLLPHDHKRASRHHFLVSILLLFVALLPFNAPILIIWIRNLSVHWFVPFSSDHSVLAIAPFLVYIELLTNDRAIVPRLTSK